MDSDGLTPLLKWAGGKRWQVPLIKRLHFRHAPRARIVEPFVGGAAITLGVDPSHAVWNDVNPHLMNFYRWCQLGLDIDVDLVAEDYDHNRDWFNALLAEGQAMSRESAVLFYYLNHFGFNGLCRFNARGEFNVPVGRRSSGPPTPFRKDIVRLRLRRVQLYCGDFAQVPIEDGDFVYVDPPYDDGFTSYNGSLFTTPDQERTLAHFVGHKGPLVITNHATPAMRMLYESAGLHVTSLLAPRRMSAKGNRAPVEELIASNFPIDTCDMMVLSSS